MNRSITIRRLLAIFMIAGLVLAPLSRPVMATTSSDVSMPGMADDTSGSATTGEMADDMPCCPSKAPAPIDCEKCLLMAACVTTSITGVLAFNVLQFPALSGGMARPEDDSWPQNLAHPPPEHPPRILV